MDECPDADGSVVRRISCILTYSGSIPDIFLNYLLFAINVAGCTCMAMTYRPGKHRYAAACLVFVVAFQIGLCLQVGCSGISITWCAMAGWMMSERRVIAIDSIGRRQSTIFSYLNYYITAMWCDGAAIVYYAIVSEPITTVAHVCAVILGATLSLLSTRLYSDHDGSSDASLDQQEASSTPLIPS